MPGIMSEDSARGNGSGPGAVVPLCPGGSSRFSAESRQRGPHLRDWPIGRTALHCDGVGRRTKPGAKDDLEAPGPGGAWKDLLRQAQFLVTVSCKFIPPMPVPFRFSRNNAPAAQSAFKKRATLPNQFQTKLNASCVIGDGDHARRRVANISIWKAEIRVVQEIEELSSKLELYLL
jgi:hypothetical protein